MNKRKHRPWAIPLMRRMPNPPNTARPFNYEAGFLNTSCSNTAGSQPGTLNSLNSSESTVSSTKTINAMMEISNIKPILHDINLLSRLWHNFYHHWIQTMMWFVHQPRQHVQLEWQMDNFEMETTKHNSMFAKDSHPFQPTHSLSRFPPSSL